jgi:nucleotide-binding universal stress UspA family protein
MSYNNILVPFDNSKLSKTVLDHAIKIAKMSSISASSANPPVKVTLLHVVQDIPALITFEIGPFK